MARDKLNGSAVVVGALISRNVKKTIWYGPEKSKNVSMLRAGDIHSSPLKTFLSALNEI